MFTSFKKVMADPEITTAGKSVFLNLLSRMDKKGYTESGNRIKIPKVLFIFSANAKQEEFPIEDR